MAERESSGTSTGIRLTLKGRDPGSGLGSTFKFPDNLYEGKDHKYLVIIVEALFRPGLANDYNFYVYEWVGFREVSGTLQIDAKNSLNGAVSGLCFFVKNLETGKTVEMITGKNGTVKEGFKAEIAGHNSG